MESSSEYLQGHLIVSSYCHSLILPAVADPSTFLGKLIGVLKTFLMFQTKCNEEFVVQWLRMCIKRSADRYNPAILNKILLPSGLYEEPV